MENIYKIYHFAINSIIALLCVALTYYLHMEYYGFVKGIAYASLFISITSILFFIYPICVFISIPFIIKYLTVLSIPLVYFFGEYITFIDIKDYYSLAVALTIFSVFNIHSRLTFKSKIL